MRHSDNRCPALVASGLMTLAAGCGQDEAAAELPGRVVEVEIAPDVAIAEVSDRYLSVAVTLGPRWGGPSVAYVLTAEALDSKRLELNGVALVAHSDGTLPDLASVEGTAGEAMVPPLAYAFFVFPEADAAACK